jgi:hypothetical protein
MYLPLTNPEQRATTGFFRGSYDYESDIQNICTRMASITMKQGCARRLPMQLDLF